MESGRKLAVIVEDDPDVRNLLRTVLTQSGFETILTSNGEDGVAAVRANDPVLTTLDVSMPGMDGIAAAAQIREFSTTYIIMITAQDDEIDVISGLNAGADEYLSKPFRPRELRARIDSLLRRPRLTPEAPSAPATDPEDGLWRRPGSPLATPTPAEQPAPPVAWGGPTPPAAPPVVPSAAPVAQPAPLVESSPTVAPIYAPDPRQGNPVPSPAPAPAPQVPAAAQQHIPAVSAGAGQSLTVGEGLYAHAGLALDVAARTVTADGQGVSLDGAEFELLRTLLSTGRRVRSKADLVLTARGESYVTSYFVTENDKRNIDLQIESLRRKLGDLTDPPRWIETIDGVGYRMTA